MCHGRKVAYFLACSHLAVDVKLGMVPEMSESAVLVVASDPLPQLVLPLALALLCVPELAPVAASFGLRFQYPILSGGGTVLGVTGRLFFELRVATVMLPAEHGPA